MVKNFGGNKSKKFGRKHLVDNTANRKLRLKEDTDEVYACVSKMLGNGMCEVYTEDNTRLIAHIRNKFRGKQKRHNMISTTSLVMVGLREWENPVKNSDIMEIYSDSQVDQLKNIPSIKIDNVMKLRIGVHGVTPADKTHDDFDFTEDTESKTEELPPNKVFTESFTMKEMEEVDLDDI